MQRKFLVDRDVVGNVFHTHTMQKNMAGRPAGGEADLVNAFADGGK